MRPEPGGSGRGTLRKVTGAASGYSVLADS
jgi:hypothetical protein